MENSIQFATGKDVELTNGFFAERQKLNSTISIKSVYDRFFDTGRIDAFKCNWHSSMPNKPHIFWDSDVAKWMESASYILRDENRPDLYEKVEQLIDEIQKNQCEDGYFNIYYQTIDPSNRFTQIGNHELYCAGHLIEAAVAYYECTGRDRFLKIMCRYADLIDRVFRVEHSAAFDVPGHEEIELALVRLFHATNQKKYLELAKYFVDKRGTDPSQISTVFLYSNVQNHLPAREQKKAMGHCVRAVYFYSGMADIAAEYGDEQLYEACRELFSDIADRKMYITGGIGSTYRGEAFTIPFDLPPVQAYTESCAAIGLCFFAHRMQRLDKSTKYADVIERILYNGFLSSTSLDGKAFFYENPLEVHPKLRDRNLSTAEKDRFPITQRLEVFGCSCCPPNITRFIPCLGDYIYSYDKDTLFVSQFMDSKASICGADVKMITNYPVDGKISLTISGGSFSKVAVRRPEWCGSLKVECAEKHVESDGYIIFNCNGSLEADIEFDMTPYLVECSPFINDEAGKYALCRGPVVYCMEGIDNGETVCDIRIKRELDAKVIYDGTLSGIPEIQVEAVRKAESKFDGLYKRSDKVSYEQAVAKFIPYFAFANRGETDMTIFFAIK